MGKRALLAESGLTFPVYLIAVMCVMIVAAIVEGTAPKAVLRLFPAPIVMFILVLIIALIALSVNSDGGFFFEISQQTIDSDVLQAIYLPPLLFSDVMRLNIRVFRKSFWQVNWLIFPGVIGGAALTALFPLFFMPSGPPFFSTYEAFAFGSAMSTTDPIAILMMLNDVGAPKRLAALVGGESLLNDGSSIVLLTLFLQLQAGENFTGGSIVAFCFQEILVGPCIGLLTGVVTLVIMYRVQHNAVALVALSFAVPYLTFAICIFYLETSGVLAVITLGLTLNRFGHAFLSKDIHAVEGFWDQVEFIAVMTLYAQVGVFVAADFLQGNISATDWGSLVAFFLYVLLVRLVVVVVSYPVLSRTGYGLSWKEAIVVWHAGLRGAVSILLSLSIKNSPGVNPRTGALVLFFTAGVVVLMLLNVITTKPLCILLGIKFDSSNKVYVRMRNRLEENTLQTLLCTGMSEDDARKGIDFPREPDSLISDKTKKPASSLVKSDDDDKTGQQATSHPFRRQPSLSEIDEKLMSAKRQHMCASFRATFSALQEAELISRPAWFLLVSACERRMDANPCLRLLRWEDITQSGTTFNRMARLILAMSKAGFQRSPSNHQRLKEATLDRFSSLKENEPQQATQDLPERNRDLFRLVETLTYCAFGLLIGHQRGRRTVNEIFSAFSEGEADDDEFPAATGSFKYSRELRKLVTESLHDCERPAQFLDYVFKHFPRVIERVKMAHTKAQVHNKNIQILAGLKRVGFAQGVALKQLYMEIEKLDSRVDRLDFPVLPPYTVGEQGGYLVGNPNFGPFGLMKAKRIIQNGLISNVNHTADTREKEGPSQQSSLGALNSANEHNKLGPETREITSLKPAVIETEWNQEESADGQPEPTTEKTVTPPPMETTATMQPTNETSIRPKQSSERPTESVTTLGINELPDESLVNSPKESDSIKSPDIVPERDSIVTSEVATEVAADAELDRVLDKLEEVLAATDIADDPDVKTTL